jgi:DNA invertase Pin-like site-specific DNA recombinase
MGKMVFTFLGAVAEFERALICERVKAGLATARAKGQKLGRPSAEVNMDAVRARMQKGESLRGIARSLEISAALLHKRLKAGVAAQ